MTGITTYLPILTLNANASIPQSKDIIVSWIKKQDLTIDCIHEIYLTGRKN
jgi:hypothetical protein